MRKPEHIAAQIRTLQSLPITLRVRCKLYTMAREVLPFWPWLADLIVCPLPCLHSSSHLSLFVVVRTCQTHSPIIALALDLHLPAMVFLQIFMRLAVSLHSGLCSNVAFERLFLATLKC